MAKRRYGMTEAKIVRFEKEGRGRGIGVDYKPWLTVHDLSSLGRVGRLQGWHNRRVHHLLSDVEKAVFLEFDWRDDVTDIREQFPLDRRTTRIIAAGMGVAHPRDPFSQVDIVMTTDFVVDFAKGFMKAVACKTESDLLKPRVREKLEIERRYWERLGCPWAVKLDSMVDKVRAEGLAYLHEFIDADRWSWVDSAYWPARVIVFLRMLARAAADRPFSEFASKFDRTPGFGPGDAVATMRYLACRKMIRFDLNVKFDHTAALGRSIDMIARPAMSAAA